MAPPRCFRKVWKTMKDEGKLLLVVIWTPPAALISNSNWKKSSKRCTSVSISFYFTKKNIWDHSLVQYFQGKALEPEQQTADGTLRRHLPPHWARWQLQRTAAESLWLLHNRLQCSTSLSFWSSFISWGAACRAESAGRPAWIMQSAHGSRFSDALLTEEQRKMNSLRYSNYLLRR